jgi:hypothetical protein
MPLVAQVVVVAEVRVAVRFQLHAPAGEEQLGKAAMAVVDREITRTTHSRAAVEVL